jgi:hypothetical protein
MASGLWLPDLGWRLVELESGVKVITSNDCHLCLHATYQRNWGCVCTPNIWIHHHQQQQQWYPHACTEVARNLLQSSASTRYPALTLSMGMGALHCSMCWLSCSTSQHRTLNPCLASWCSLAGWWSLPSCWWCHSGGGTCNVTTNNNGSNTTP